MSRFFATGDTSSESSSESEEEQQIQAPVVTKAPRFIDSDDEDDVKRVVKSAKDKQQDELDKIYKDFKNHRKINDWTSIQTDFENLMKVASKIRSGANVPATLVTILIELEDLIKVTSESKESKDKMSKLNAKSFTAVKQNIKKQAKLFEAKMAEARKSAPTPATAAAAATTSSSSTAGDKEDVEASQAADAKASKAKPAAAKKPSSKGKKAQTASDSDSGSSSSSSSSSESESGSDSEDDKSAKKKPVAKKAPASAKSPAANEDDESASEWSESETSSSESDDDDSRTYSREYFLKKTTEKPVKKRQAKVVKPAKPSASSAAANASASVEGDGTGADGQEEVKVEKPLFPKDAEITHSLIIGKLQELVAARGKKGTDKAELVETLRKLCAISDAAGLGLGLSLKIRFNIVSAEFDFVTNAVATMSGELWSSCHADICDIVASLSSNPAIVVGDFVSDDDENVTDATKPYVIAGSVIGLVERLDDEFLRSLQSIDPHTTEYVERLKDESRLINLIMEATPLIERSGVVDNICRAYIRRIEHIYFKVDMREFAASNSVTPATPTATSASASAPPTLAHTVTGTSELSSTLMTRLCKYIYHNDQTDRIRSRAMLCHVYYNALHDRWYEARDLMLMSHLQESITNADVQTQVLFNRAMVQLGLCAFRCGLIRDAHTCLHDLINTSRIKELLAQAITQQKFGVEKNFELEKIEKRRQLPFHMHINVELVECAYLTAAFLLEVPNMAQHVHDYQKRVISRLLRKNLDYHNKQVFHGPPETTRDHVIASARALAACKWRECQSLLLSIKAWKLFPNSEKVKAMLSVKIQEEGLRTYLFTYSSIYTSISIQSLAEMFELPAQTVHGIVSKMIMNEQLQASLHQPSNTISMHRAELSKLHYLSIQLSEKNSALLESNERIFEQRTGSVAFRDQLQQTRTGGSQGNASYQQRRNQGNAPGNQMNNRRPGNAGYFGQNISGGNYQQSGNRNPANRRYNNNSNTNNPYNRNQY